MVIKFIIRIAELLNWSLVKLLALLNLKFRNITALLIAVLVATIVVDELGVTPRLVHTRAGREPQLT